MAFFIELHHKLSYKIGYVWRIVYKLMNGNVAAVRNSDFVSDNFSANNKCINYNIFRKLK